MNKYLIDANQLKELLGYVHNGAVTSATKLTPIKPLTDYDLQTMLMEIDPEAKRLPPGFKLFARAIERHHFGELE